MAVSTMHAQCTHNVHHNAQTDAALNSRVVPVPCELCLLLRRFSSLLVLNLTAELLLQCLARRLLLAHLRLLLWTQRGEPEPCVPHLAIGSRRERCCICASTAAPTSTPTSNSMGTAELRRVLLLLLLVLWGLVGAAWHMWRRGHVMGAHMWDGRLRAIAVGSATVKSGGAGVPKAMRHKEQQKWSVGTSTPRVTEYVCSHI